MSTDFWIRFTFTGFIVGLSTALILVAPNDILKLLGVASVYAAGVLWGKFLKEIGML